MLPAGANPMDLKRGIDKAVDAITSDLEKQAKKVGNSSEKIKQVASISANNDDTIGELISQAFGKVGKEGVITVEEAKGTWILTLMLLKVCNLTEVIYHHTLLPILIK